MPDLWLCFNFPLYSILIQDACTSKPCPSDADCQSVPGEGSGHICRCTKSDYSYSSKTSTCEKIAGEKKLFKVTGMKFNQDYRKEFADTNSKPFKEKAAELEGSLNDTVCPRSGCEGIKVTKIGKGSIVVDFIAIFPKNTVVTAAQVQTAAVEALSDPKLADLSPDNTTTPKAQGKYLKFNFSINSKLFSRLRYA